MPAIAEEHFRNKIGAMISRGFVFDAVRDSLDLKGVSEVWGGPATDTCPAWYFWLSISRGAYRLRLEQAETTGGAGAPVPRSLLSIKYYPSPHEPAFRHFSERERSLIEGPLFDHTNTPAFDGQDKIPESFFHVGSMEFVDDVASGRAYLTYSSLDRMRYRHRSAAPGAGAASRELPAWDLGYPLFDAFVGLHSFLTRTAPTRVILSRQPGFEFVESARGDFECRDAGDRAFKSLLVACSAGDGGPASPVEDRMCSDLLASPWTPVLDCKAGCVCGGGRHPHGHGHGHSRGRADQGVRGGHGHSLRGMKMGDETWEIPLAFNEQWWRLATAEQAAKSMPCGCH